MQRNWHTSRVCNSPNGVVCQLNGETENHFANYFLLSKLNNTSTEQWYFSDAAHFTDCIYGWLLDFRHSQTNTHQGCAVKDNTICVEIHSISDHQWVWIHWIPLPAEVNPTPTATVYPSVFIKYPLHYQVFDWEILLPFGSFCPCIS